MSPFRLWLTLGALSIPIILVSIDLNGIVVLLPQIGADLGASADEVGSIVTVASITSCAPLLLWVGWQLASALAGYCCSELLYSG